MTADDYRFTPEGAPYFQLIGGCLIEEPSPSYSHQETLISVAMALRVWSERRGEGKLCIAPLDVWLTGGDVVQPDVFYVSQARRIGLREDGMHGAPDLVVEVISQSTERLESDREKD